MVAAVTRLERWVTANGLDVETLGGAVFRMGTAPAFQTEAMMKLSVMFGGERVDLEDDDEEKLVEAMRNMAARHKDEGRLFPQRPVSFFTEFGIANVSHGILQTPRVRNERIVQREDGTENRA